MHGMPAPAAGPFLLALARPEPGGSLHHRWLVPAFPSAHLQRRQPASQPKLSGGLSAPLPPLASRWGRNDTALRLPIPRLRYIVWKKGEKRMLQAYISGVSDIS
jgi:hypothetical protein